MLTRESFTPSLKEKFKGPDPVSVKPTTYTPVSSPNFSDFVVQSYMQYSPFLTDLLTKRAAGITATEKKEPDRDACKKRPTKVETFYYQSFVRDYLSRGTPYRGLLVYHGLGTGKTCTSIAAAEALFWGGQKTIYVMTPASLSNNYRKDLGKCGYFPLRSHNQWAFLKLTEGRAPQLDPVYIWLVEGLGLPPALVMGQGGGWVPNPDSSNWDSLSSAVQESIRKQQLAHLDHRFKFIHYNGILYKTISRMAAEAVAVGKPLFDNSVVIIDEIHNLVRTINGTRIGKASIPEFMGKTEVREPTWTMPMNQKIPGYGYPRGYTFYRLLQNAVGAKIIGLSATPMINYSQEFAILLNIIGGEQRLVEISLKGLTGSIANLQKWAQQHKHIDFFEIGESVDRKPVLNVTPVPYGFVKVVKGDYSTRGFVRVPPAELGEPRERNMAGWAAGLIQELDAAKILASGGTYVLHTFPMLPDDASEFVETFVDRNTLDIKNKFILKARASGLISYYRGGSEELMPRTGVNKLVLVPMSDNMFKEYSVARMAEIDVESKDSKKPGEPAVATEGKRAGMTGAEADLYAQATSVQSKGFLCLSRAACNFVFPDEIDIEPVTANEKVNLLGIEPDRILSVEKAAVEGSNSSSSAAAAAPVEETSEGEEEAATATATTAVVSKVGALMAALEAKSSVYLNEALTNYSTKYAAMIANVRASVGPALIYSQFITLEGLGIFAAALRASPDQYTQLVIRRVGGEWRIPDELLTPEALARPRYIIYTGAQSSDEKRILLQLYNADVAALPPTLAAQCTTMLAGAPDNRDGRICRVFMISSSGAEGISLFNTRQVHIMEPYWNNVRLQQVVGRAIRLCSHMNLPWEDRVVDVYTYLSVFPKKKEGAEHVQDEKAKKLMMVDKGLTTDQMIYNIAMKKQKLADGLYEIAQTAAVDCQLHFHEHGAATQCFVYKEGARPLFAYHPNWKKDLTEAGTRAATEI
jgi:hypothetical protein